MKKIAIPKYAKIIKGSWKKEFEYGNIWCRIEDIHISSNEMSLIHPKYGEFAWVSFSDCEFSDTMPKEYIDSYRKDGYYVTHKNNDTSISYFYDTDLNKLKEHIAFEIGKRNKTNASKWNKYIFTEFKNGIKIKSFTL